MLNINNPKGYALDSLLVFQNAGKTSTDIQLTQASTTYSSAIEIPKDTNRRIAIEIVPSSAGKMTIGTMALNIYACVGDTATPSAKTDQPIAVIPTGDWNNTEVKEWVLPATFAGYKYIRLAFVQEATGTLTNNKNINAFMHGLA